ncbi:MAG: T9SS type A sorting domain-containing protein [Ignavibacteria bacterium]|nr:T9SS type A sorting domain-containing protein [Ignavibacteria bacterium]
MYSRTLAALPILAALLVVAGSSVQAQKSSDMPAEDAPVMSVYSPFAHLIDAFAPAKKQAAVPWICPSLGYYDPAGNNITFTESVPTSKFAIRVTPPSLPAAAPCTVWTVHVDFELLNAGITEKDTIQFFVREVSAPYTQIFTTYYLARGGDNFGEFEIDPPVVPPYNIRAIISTKRSLYVGYYVRGYSSHSVAWRFKGPSIYSNPIRSVAFLSSTSVTDASNVVGQSVDWNAVVRLCCQYPPPVELSLLTGSEQDGKVSLAWKTESETNNFGFEVQRAFSGTGPWETRGMVPGNGNSSMARWYSYSDAVPAGMEPLQNQDAVWYRLVQIDYDGTRNESHAVRVALGETPALISALSEVFPNPLSASSAAPAVIRYRLASEEAVRLSVVDALGRDVAVPIDRVQPAGQYETTWYPSQSSVPLQTGAYFIRMQAGATSSVRKIMVVR